MVKLFRGYSGEFIILVKVPHLAGHETQILLILRVFQNNAMRRNTTTPQRLQLNRDTYTERKAMEDKENYYLSPEKGSTRTSLEAMSSPSKNIQKRREIKAKSTVIDVDDDDDDLNTFVEVEETVYKFDSSSRSKLQQVDLQIDSDDELEKIGIPVLSLSKYREEVIMSDREIELGRHSNEPIEIDNDLMSSNIVDLIRIKGDGNSIGTEVDSSLEREEKLGRNGDLDNLRSSESMANKIDSNRLVEIGLSARSPGSYKSLSRYALENSGSRKRKSLDLGGYNNDFDSKKVKLAPSSNGSSLNGSPRRRSSHLKRELETLDKSLIERSAKSVNLKEQDIRLQFSSSAGNDTPPRFTAPVAKSPDHAEIRQYSESPRDKDDIESLDTPLNNDNDAIQLDDTTTQYNLNEPTIYHLLSPNSRPSFSREYINKIENEYKSLSKNTLNKLKILADEKVKIEEEFEEYKSSSYSREYVDKIQNEYILLSEEILNKLSTVTNEKVKIEQEIEELKSSIYSKEYVHRLQNDHKHASEELLNKLTTLNEEKVKAEQELEEFKSSISILRIQKDVSEAQAKSNEREFSSMVKQVKSHNSTISNLNQDMDKLRTENESYLSAKNQLEDKIYLLENKMTLLSETLDKQAAELIELEGLQRQVKNSNQKLNTLNQELESYKSLSEKIQQERNILSEQVDKYRLYEVKFEDLKKSYDKEFKEINEVVYQQTLIIRSKTDEINEKDDVIHNLQQHKKASSERVQLLEDKNNQFKRLNRELEEKIDDDAKTLREYVSKLKIMSDEVNGRHNNVEELTKQIDLLSNKLDKSEHENSILREQSNTKEKEYTKQIDEYNAELVKRAEENREDLEKLGEYFHKTYSEKLKEKNQETLRAITSKHNELQRNYDSLTRKMEEVERENTHLLEIISKKSSHSR